MYGVGQIRGRRYMLGLALGLLVLPGLGLVPSTPAEDGLLAVPAGACDADHFLMHAGWEMCWFRDDLRAQGLEMHNVTFHGENVAARIGVPFTITEYDDHVYGPYKDILGEGVRNPGFGNGAMTIRDTDCPRFLGQGQLLDLDRLCVETRVGPEPMIVLWARFDLHNYRFLQGYRLDSRGVIEPFVRLGGTLIDGNTGESGASHAHHLYWRLDLDVGAPGGDVLERRASTAPLTALTDGCLDTRPGSLTGWFAHDRECTIVQEDGRTRWRVADPTDRNARGYPKSIEVHVTSDLGAGTFATFDAMLLQSKGMDAEIGYEVPIVPVTGDTPLAAYHTPAEPVDDPVLWIAQHIHHDPRDEDRGTMTYHEASIMLMPRDLFGQNPGEDTYRS